jgi:hypothetical protein
LLTILFSRNFPHCIFLFAITSYHFVFLLLGAKRGLLIRGGDVLERLAGIDALVLDKVRVFSFVFFIFHGKLLFSMLCFFHYKQFIPILDRDTYRRKTSSYFYCFSGI